MRRKIQLTAAALSAASVLLAAGLAPGQQGDYRWQYGASVSYLTGDYGSDDDTDMIYLPLTAKRYLSWGDVSIVVPYLDISSGGSSTVIDGTVVPTAGADAAGGSGLGDIVLRGRYYAVRQDGALPYIDLVGKVKLPTGDEGKDLGTGEADVTAAAELSRWVDREYLLLAELGYTLIGDPPGVDYDNRVSYSFGAGRMLDPDWLVIGYLDGRTAISDGDDPLSLLLTAEYRERNDLRFDIMLELGLTDGSPDLGLTLGVRLKRW